MPQQQAESAASSHNPFAELVDTQASSLDQLISTASLSKPTLTTVIHNPLARWPGALRALAISFLHVPLCPAGLACACAQGMPIRVCFDAVITCANVTVQCFPAIATGYGQNALWRLHTQMPPNPTRKMLPQQIPFTAQQILCPAYLW